MSGKYAVISVCAGLMILAAVVFGGRAKDSQIGPPEIQYGHDVCSRCNMILSDSRFAAATVADGTDGQRHNYMFDDIGCAVEYEREQPGQKVLARYVMDVQGRQWLDAGAAWYVRSRQIVSPMAYGVAALAEQSQATEMASETAGQVLDLAQLQARILNPAAAAPALSSATEHEHDHRHGDDTHHNHQ